MIDRTEVAIGMYRAKIPVERIAEILGCHWTRVYQILRAAGIQRRAATDEEILAAYRRLGSARAVARTVRCSQDRARTVIRAAGLAIRPRGRRPFDVDSEIIGLHRCGLAPYVIAQRLGVHAQTVRDHMQRLGLPVVRGGHQPILLPEHGTEVARLRAEGMRWADVAVELGVSVQVLWAARRRYGW